MFTEKESEPTEETTTETEGKTTTEMERVTTTETEGTTTTTPQGNTSEFVIGSSVASCNKCSEWEAVEVTKNLHGGVRVNRELVDRVKELGRDQTIRLKVDVMECRACGKQFVGDCQRTDKWEGQQQESVV